MPLSSDKHIVDAQFRKQLHNYKVQPSGAVWNKLSDSLHLEKKKNSNGKRLLLVVLLLLTGSGGIWMSSRIQPKDDDLILSKLRTDETAVSQHISVIETTAEGPLKAQKHIPVLQSEDKEMKSLQPVTEPEQVSSSHNIYSSLAEPAEFSVENTTQVPIAWTEDAYYAEPLTSNTLFGIAAPAQKITQRKANQSLSPVVYKNPKYYLADASGLYIGFGENLNSTHIIDRRAFHDENLKYTPTFGTAFMLHGGYNMNNKWGMEVAWVIHSQEGQRYKYLPADNRTTSLEYNQKHVSFNYMQFPVMARYKVQGWSGITETPIFVNYSVGFQYGRLLSYSVDETKERVSEQNLFRRNEYALVAGVDYDFLSRKAAFYTVGLRASYGSDLFVKDVPEYLEFDRPHNVVIGIHGAVSFSLKKMPRNPSGY